MGFGVKKVGAGKEAFGLKAVLLALLASDSPMLNYPAADKLLARPRAGQPGRGPGRLSLRAATDARTPIK
jgi:hypothetical protein